ncbi:hypothetical protein B0G77_4801 [Paraburkholderia sp. BL10I2N1]|nr:hypothetical protein B0G77_4801 [Paraburkholderia sp. BL10I2N1]
MGWVRENVYRVILAATCAAQIGSACASVIMPGTRVIYDGNAREQSLQFTNQDDGPGVTIAPLSSSARPEGSPLGGSPRPDWLKPGTGDSSSE